LAEHVGRAAEHFNKSRRVTRFSLFLYQFEFVDVVRARLKERLPANFYQWEEKKSRKTTEKLDGIGTQDKYVMKKQ